MRASMWRGLALGLLILVGVWMYARQGEPVEEGSISAAPAGQQMLAITVLGNGQVTGAEGQGISCERHCNQPLREGTRVTLTAQAAPGHAFSGWVGACNASSKASCEIAMERTSTALAHFVAVTGGAPNIAYTDTPSAPTRGGENDLGGYLSIFGQRFGSVDQLGKKTKVFIGDREVANYRYFGPAKVGARLGLQQIAVQVGALSGAQAGKALPVKVVVDGVVSNTDQTFTPTKGRILFVSLSGSDATALASRIDKPWRYLQNGSNSGVYYAMGAGDQVVIRGGEWNDALGIDGTWMRASLGASARNGSPDAWIHVTAYPGPIDGHAIEDVHYTAPNGKAGGIHGPWQAISGTSGEYWAISNLRMEMSAQSQSDAAPFNTQYTGGHWRIVNNELGPWPVAGVRAARAAGVTGRGDDVKVLGNRIHDIGGTLALENHGIYLDGGSRDWEIAWNWIHDITGGSLVQMHDANALAGKHTLPHGGTWMGFSGMRVHDNWLENAAKYGLTVSDEGSEGSSRVEYRAWNNVIIGTKLPPVRMKSTAKLLDMSFANNTIYNAMTSNSGGGNGYFRNEGQGDGEVRVYNNVLAIGSQTIGGTRWVVDAGSASARWRFADNLYWDAGRGVKPPSDDAMKVAADPQFVHAPGGDLRLQATSPAVGNKARQSQPAGREGSAAAHLGALSAESARPTRAP